MQVPDLSQRTFKGTNGRDEFQREKIAEKVIRLLTSPIEISPMLIDGDWGTGKTEFCHKLINKLKEENTDFQVIYIDAFRADHADNPLLTVLSAVLSLLPNSPQKALLRNKAIPILRFAAVTVGKAVAAHVLQQNTESLADGIEESLQDAADHAIDGTIKALLKDHEEAEKNLQALQTTLSEIAAENPITIFIDELDRCRPDFAVQMLETVKHTFNVEGVQFVFVTNTRQLKAAINHRYGQQVDAQRYLDKFLKFSFRLPDFIPAPHRNLEELNQVSAHHFLLLIKNGTVLKETSLADTSNWICQFTTEVVQKNSLSLREVETFVRYLEIYQQMSENLTKRQNGDPRQAFLIFGVFLFCFYPEISASLQKGKSNADTLACLLGISQLPSVSQRRTYTSDIAVLISQECFINQEKYFPPESDLESKEQWEKTKKMYLGNSWGDLTNSHSLIKEVLCCLQLGAG